MADKMIQNEFKVFKRRWYMLLLYVIYMCCNSSQWLQYATIASTTTKFYNVTLWHVNLTSLIMMGWYLPLALPAASLMNLISLRTTAILGTTGTALGSWIKVASAYPDGFNVTLVGHTIVAISQVLMLSVPQKLSSIWFGQNEVSTACSIGVFGFQLGIVVGFFLPPVLVKNHVRMEDIGEDFYWMFIYFAVVSSVVAVLVVLTFQAEPPIPPSLGQVKARKREEKTKFAPVIKRLLTQRHLVALFVTTGVNNGCFNGLSTLLSQILVEYFPGKEEDAGRIGVTLVVFGMIGSILFGYILDRTKQFKFILLLMFYMSAVGMAVLTVMLYFADDIWSIYFAAGFVGTFLCGFTAISFDVATELTYPEPEIIVGTIMNMMSLLFTFLTTLVFAIVNEKFGSLYGNIGFIFALLVGATCTLPIRFELKRNEAQKSDGKLEEMRILNS